MRQYVLILFIFLCGNHRVSAQEDVLIEKEKELVKIYEKMRSFRYDDNDSLVHYGNLFNRKLSILLNKYPKTLVYPFKLLKENAVCTIATSKDGLFRTYSWDSQLGGTMRFYCTMYQYKIGEKVDIQDTYTELWDPGCFYSEIFTLKTKNQTYYLGISNSIYSSKDVGQSIKAFQLTDKGVNDSILLMKTSNGLKNALDVQYDFFSVVDRPERPVSVIKYNEKKKIISVSETNEKEEIIATYKTYQFNGTYFEEKTIKSKSKK